MALTLLILKPKRLCLFLCVLCLVSCSPISAEPVRSSATPGITITPTSTVYQAEHTPTFTISPTLQPTLAEVEVTSTATFPVLTPTPTLESTPILPVLPLTKIVFDGFDGHFDSLPIINTQGEVVLKVAQGVFWPSYVSWSPDGHWIAFNAAYEEGEYGDIYIVSADGSRLKRITYPPQPKYSVSWSPDGKYLVYIEGADATDIAVVSVDGKKSWKLTYTPGLESEPAWSPDGKQIAYLYQTDYYDGASLWVMNADGSNSQQVMDYSGGLDSVSWSPDGKQFAVTLSSVYSCGTIYLVNVDGSEKKPLKDVTGCAKSPVWSPDGMYMAYLGSQKKKGDQVTEGWQIHIMQADGSNDRAITPPEWAPRYFSWAPVPILEIGSTYRTTDTGAELNLRLEPSLASRVLKQVPAGEEVVVLEGPVDQDGYYWWRLKTQDAVEGWAVEFLGWYQAVE